MKLREEYLPEGSASSGNRHRWYNIYTCDHCGKEYKKQKRQAEGKPSEHFCSASCQANETSRVQLICDHCSALFYRSKSKLLNSRSGKMFCCRECKDIAQSYMEEIQPDHYGTGEGNYRARALKHYGNSCKLCGYTIEDALEVHHIDKNRDNNDLDNLVVLCCNCHTLVHRGVKVL